MYSNDNRSCIINKNMSNQSKQDELTNHVEQISRESLNVMSINSRV